MNTPSLIEAESYFAEHLDCEYWNAQPEKKRSAALTMATRQISAVASDCVEAVCEQAVYLLRTHNSTATGKLVVSQSLDGVGSQSFQYTGATTGKYAGLSPAAVQLIEAVPRGTVRFDRG